MALAKCLTCGWEGDEDVLEVFRCPQCGSRRLKTEGSRLSDEEALRPPPDAQQGEEGGM